MLFPTTGAQCNNWRQLRSFRSVSPRFTQIVTPSAHFSARHEHERLDISTMGDYDRGGWGNQGGGGGYNQGGYDQGGGGFGGDRGGDRGNSYGGAWGGGGGSRGGRGGGGGGGFSNVRPGDWSCPNGCGNVFASKSNCFRCGVPKPEGAGDSVRPQISPEPRLITYGPALGNAEKTSNRLPSTN